MPNLHLNYRPQRFQDLVGQYAVGKTLAVAISKSQLPSSFLFVGTRGTGKTTTARILAKAITCTSEDRPVPVPCGKCKNCLAIESGSSLDVKEIDAASNSGVDQVRDIIASCSLAPAHSRAKVIIIDECHSLSNSAANALLKTLEEPPENVYFILATTEKYKVLETIRSRCQIHNFGKVDSVSLAEHITTVANSEGLNIADDVVAALARYSDGSVRNALTALEKLGLEADGKPITIQAVQDQMSTVPNAVTREILQAIADKDTAKLLTAGQGLEADPKEGLSSLVLAVTSLLMHSAGLSPDQAFGLDPNHKSTMVAVSRVLDARWCLKALDTLMAADKHLETSSMGGVWAMATLARLI